MLETPFAFLMYPEYHKSSKSDAGFYEKEVLSIDFARE